MDAPLRTVLRQIRYLPQRVGNHVKLSILDATGNDATAFRTAEHNIVEGATEAADLALL